MKNVFSDTKCKYESYSKEDFAVLTGTVTTSGSGTTTYINYPSGFTKDNCIPLIIGSKKSDADDYTYLSTGLTDSLAYVSGTFRGFVRFKTDNIEMKTYVYNDYEITTNYKIVLMKIGTGE